MLTGDHNLLSPATLLTHYFSVDSLRDIAKDAQVKFSSLSKNELSIAIVDAVGIPTAWELLDRADLGKSALYLYFGSREMPDQQELESQLQRETGYNPFELSEAAVSRLGNIPIVAAARKLGNSDSIRLYWSRRVATSFQYQFTIQQGYEDEYAMSEITPGDKLVRCWGSNEMARLTALAMGAQLGFQLGPVVLERSAIESLRRRLPSSTLEFEDVVDERLGFGSVAAHRHPDQHSLEDAEGYEAILSGQPIRRATIHFRLSDTDPTVSLQVGRSGSFWFRSYATRPVVNLVLSSVREILDI